MSRSQEIIFLASPLILSVIILGGGSPLASLICSALMLCCYPFNRGQQWSVPIYFKWFWGSLILYLVILVIPAPPMIRHWISPQIGALQATLWPAYWLPLAFRPTTHVITLCWLVTATQWVFALRQRESITESILKIMCLFAGMITLFAWSQQLLGVQQIYGFTNIPTQQREWSFGPFVNPNHGGIWLGALLPVSLIFNRRWVSALIVGGILTTGSRGAIVGAAVGFGVLFWADSKSEDPAVSRIWSVAAIITSLLIGKLVLTWTNLADFTSLRTQIWADSLDLISLSPAVGVGLGGFIDGFPLVKSLPLYTRTHHAHSEGLELLIELGVVPGLISLIALAVALTYAFSTVRTNTSSIQKAALAGCCSMLVSSSVEFPFQLNSISLLFLLYASMLLPTTFSSVPLKSRLPTALGACAVVIAAMSLGFVQMSYGQQALTPLDETMHHKRLLSQQLRKEEIQAVQQLAPNNAMTWIASAQQLKKFHAQTETCSLWNRALQLELPSPATGLLEQFLGCSTNPDLVSISTPDSEHILIDLGDLLSIQYPELAEEYYTRAAALGATGITSYALWLLRNNLPLEAFSEIQKIEVNNCSVHKTRTKILQKLNAIETFEELQKANQSCGKEIFSPQQRLRWGLVAADSESINEARYRYKNSSKPAELELLVQAMSKHNHPELCDWIRILARLRSEHRENIGRCKEKKPLKGFPISRYRTLKQIIVDTPAQDK